MAYKKVEKMAIDDKMIDLTGYVKKDDIINIIAPVGHTMIRLDNKNPSSLPGYEATTWELVSQGRAIIGANANYPLGSEGGSPDAVVVQHTHVQNPHTHTQNAHTHTQNAHTHTQNAHTHTQNAHSHENVGWKYTMVAPDYRLDADTYLRLAPTSSSTNARYYTYGLKGASGEGGIAERNQIMATATNQTATATNQNATAVNQNATAVNQNATATNQNTGVSGLNKNMMPYKAFNIWTRIA